MYPIDFHSRKKNTTGPSTVWLPTKYLLLSSAKERNAKRFETT